MLASPALRYGFAGRTTSASRRSESIRTTLVSPDVNNIFSEGLRLKASMASARDLSDSDKLPMTQELLAQMIGVPRNAASIVAQTLQRTGIIRYSRGHIEITDVGGLQATSCECYNAVELQYDRVTEHSE